MPYFYVSYPSKQTTKLVNGPIIEQTFNEYIIQSASSGENVGLNDYSGNRIYYFVRPDESETFNYELNENQTSSSVYKRTHTLYSAFDDYGNPDTITTTNQDMTNQNAPVYKKTTCHIYASADIRNEFDTHKYYWVLGRLTESSTTFEAPGTDNIIKKSGFSYYPPDSEKKYGMLYKERNYRYNSNNILTTKLYKYDKFGNITKSITTAEGCASCEVIEDSTNYTPNGRFISDLVNPAGFISTQQYDPLLATLLFEFDINNLKTEFQYDGFGRLEKGIAPDGTISATALLWVLPGDAQAPEHAIYYSWQQTSGKPEVKVYYYADGAVDSIMVETHEKTSRKYKYDDAGHLQEYNDASQGILKYVHNAYGQLVSDTNANKQVTTYKYDLLGRLLVKKTYEGDFTYQYDLQKKGLLDYVDGPGNKVSYTYDNFSQTTYSDRDY